MGTPDPEILRRLARNLGDVEKDSFSDSFALITACGLGDPEVVNGLINDLLARDPAQSLKALAYLARGFADVAAKSEGLPLDDYVEGRAQALALVLELIELAEDEE